MRTREVTRNEWTSFFDVFSKQHEGWIASLEVLGDQVGAQPAGKGQAAQEICKKDGKKVRSPCADRNDAPYLISCVVSRP